MSVCTFFASNRPLSEAAPAERYPLEINIDTGTVWDGGADDNFYLIHFPNVQDYTDKQYGVRLEWNYTDGRARRILEYIKAALRETDSVELWHVWQMGYYEFEDRPYVHRKRIPVGELTAEHLKEMVDAEIWNTPDRQYPQRPSFYCLTVTG